MARSRGCRHIRGMSGPSLSREPAPRGARRVGRAALLAGIALAGAATAQTLSSAQKTAVDIFVARTSLPRAWVASIKPGLVVAIRDRDALVSRGPADRIHLVGEVVDEDVADRLGYRSMRLAVEINCETRRDRVVEMDVFPNPNLKGEARARAVPGGWVQPSDDAYMGDILRAVCKAAPRLAREDAPIPPPRPQARPSPEPARPASPVVVAATTHERAPAWTPLPRQPQALPPPPERMPAPEEPIATGPRAPRLLADADLLPAFMLAAPIVPAPAAAPVSRPPPSRAAASAGVAAEPASPPAAAAPSGPTAQVGALDSEADARRTISGLKGLLGPGLSTHVQAAKLGERTYYRAYVAGFDSRASANAFCIKLTAAGRPCLVR